MALTEAQETLLRGRFEAVVNRVSAACEKAGRPVSSVRLIAVSKYQPAAAVEAVYRLGQRDFGENYVQDLVAKREALRHLPDLRMRFIGRLQRNKARHVVGADCCVDTVDTFSLGAELSKRAVAAGRSVEALVQVNIGCEPQKAGVMPESLSELLAKLRELPNLDVIGLMAIPPKCDDAEESRHCFRALAGLAKQERLVELSMGMSGDLHVAIEEGATMVRVGTAIFGPRPPGHGDTPSAL